jgi:hypothetical protein
MIALAMVRVNQIYEADQGNSIMVRRRSLPCIRSLGGENFRCHASIVHCGLDLNRS